MSNNFDNILSEAAARIKIMTTDEVILSQEAASPRDPQKPMVRGTQSSYLNSAVIIRIPASSPNDDGTIIVQFGNDGFGKNQYSFSESEFNKFLKSNESGGDVEVKLTENGIILQNPAKRAIIINTPQIDAVQETPVQKTEIMRPVLTPIQTPSPVVPVIPTDATKSPEVPAKTTTTTTMRPVLRMRMPSQKPELTAAKLAYGKRY